MPRSGILLLLSREHHSSLVVARAARQAAECNDAELHRTTIQRVEMHGQTVLNDHFVQEEILLQRVASVFSAAVIARILEEHAILRELASQSCALEPVDRLRRFGELLAAHVRYEERELFPRIQELVNINSTV
ncbi:MAG: hemerythrin domain-containing protein [Nitrosomonas sp.]|nr:MAG: hemerythrin domain-containing protein [Nitrosomonas sp.]